MAIETHVVVLEREVYTGGPGYNGYVMKQLGFPEGPYLKGVAELFVRQARSVDKKIKFKVVEYLPE